jgi:hypothetical protein
MCESLSSLSLYTRSSTRACAGLSAIEELDVVYKALSERESDLQVAVQVGRSLLNENQELHAQMVHFDEVEPELKRAKKKLAQFECVPRHP